jgi:hypothetical protein
MWEQAKRSGVPHPVILAFCLAPSVPVHPTRARASPDLKPVSGPNPRAADVQSTALPSIDTRS